MRVLNINLQQAGVAEYRHFMPSRALVRAGHDVTYFEYQPFPANIEKFLIDNLKDFDVMHVGYVTSVEMLKLFTAARNYAQIPLVTDIDDDIHNVPTSNLAFDQYHGGSQERKISRMHLRISDGVSVTTSTLSAAINSDCRFTAVLPNCFDEASWNGTADPKRQEDKSIRIWMAGSLGHYGDYGEARDALEWALDKWNGKEGRQKVRLFCAGWIPDWAARFASDTRNPSNNSVFQVQYCYTPTYRRIVSWIAPDIVIAPLQVNKFNASKSHIKIYDAAMGGAAFLCTDHTTYEHVPSDCCIKISNTMVQWREGLQALITDASLRQRLHSHLKTYVFDVWPIDKHIHKWVEFYERVREAPIVNSLEDVVRPA